MYLGNWVANATKERKEDMRLEYEEIEQHIYKYAKDFSAEGDIQYDKKFGCYFSPRSFKEEIMPIVDEYNEDILWEDIASRLARRDLIRELGPVNK